MHDFQWIYNNLFLFTKICCLPVLGNNILAYLLPNCSNQLLFVLRSPCDSVSNAEFVYFHFVFLILCWCLKFAQQQVHKRYKQIYYYVILTEHLKKTRKISVKLKKSLSEFSVKFGIFSKIPRCEISCFPPWITLVPSKQSSRARWSNSCSQNASEFNKLYIIIQKLKIFCDHKLKPLIHLAPNNNTLSQPNRVKRQQQYGLLYSVHLVSC